MRFARSKVAAVFSLATVAAGTASAAIPTEVSTAITETTTSAGEYGTAFIGLAVGVAVAGIGLKWTKRFMNKAT